MHSSQYRWELSSIAIISRMHVVKDMLKYVYETLQNTQLCLANVDRDSLGDHKVHATLK